MKLLHLMLSNYFFVGKLNCCQIQVIGWENPKEIAYHKAAAKLKNVKLRVSNVEHKHENIFYWCHGHTDDSMVFCVFLSLVQKFASMNNEALLNRGFV